jgi:hypothetical protein
VWSNDDKNKLKIILSEGEQWNTKTKKIRGKNKQEVGIICSIAYYRGDINFSPLGKK